MPDRYTLGCIFISGHNHEHLAAQALVVSTLVDPVNWSVVDRRELGPGASILVQWTGGGPDPDLDGIFSPALSSLDAGRLYPWTRYRASLILGEDGLRQGKDGVS